MAATTTPSGCTITRARVLWIRWDARRMREVTSRPWQYIVTDPDGADVKCCDTRREADAWIAENYPTGPPCTLCGEPMPASDLNDAGECTECTDAATAANGF